MSGKHSYSAVLIIVATLAILTGNSIAETTQVLFPPNGADAVGVNTDLNWPATIGSTDSYDIYLGTDYNSVLNATRHLGDIDSNNQVSVGDLAKLADCWLSPPPVSTERLTDYWTFDTSAQNSASSNHGTLRNGAEITNSASQYYVGTGALTLDGIDDDVTIDGYKGFAGDVARTCAAWIKTDTIHTGTIIGWGQEDAGTKWQFSTQDWNNSAPDGALAIGVGGGYRMGTKNICDGNWHHVAVVLEEGDTDVSQIKLYVDGQEEIYSDVDSQLIDSALVDDVTIGSMNTAYCFNGQIDDVRIYDTALTDDETASLYTSSECDFDSDDSGIIDLGELSMIAKNWLEFGSPEFKARTTDSTYDVGTMSANLTYHWKVNEVEDNTPVASDQVYNFTTGVKVNDGLFDFVDNIADIDLDGEILYAINCGSKTNVQVGSTLFRGDVNKWYNDAGAIDLTGEGQITWWDTLYNAISPGKETPSSVIAGLTVECSDTPDPTDVDHGPYEGQHSFDVSGITSGLGNMAQVLSTAGRQNLGNPGERDMIYRLDVTPGNEYKLQLFFFKNYEEDGKPGSTGMDVLVENDLVIDGLDIYDDITNAGYNNNTNVLVYSTVLTATDSQIDIVVRRNLSYIEIGDINAITLEDITPLPPLPTEYYVTDIADIDLSGNMVYAINCGSKNDVLVGSTLFGGDVNKWYNDAGAIDLTGEGDITWWDTLYNAISPGKETPSSAIAGLTVECSETNTGVDHGPYSGSHGFNISALTAMGDMADVLATAGTQNLGNPGERDMIYRLDVTPGKAYKLQLFFFKNSTESTGMDIFVEDELVVDGLDVPVNITAAGYDKAGTVFMYSSILTATDSQIDIVIKRNSSMDSNIGDINAITLENLTDLPVATLVTYPGPAGETEYTDDYSVSVNGQDLFMYKSWQKGPMYHSAADLTVLGDPYGFNVLCSPVTFCYFDFSGGPITITVKINDSGLIQASQSHVSVKPLARGVTPIVTNGEFSFTITEPGPITIQPGGTALTPSLFKPLHIFANPLEVNPPSPGDSGVLYYGPGQHFVDRIDLTDNQTMYVAGGALVSIAADSTEGEFIKLKRHLWCR